METSVELDCHCRAVLQSTIIESGYRSFGQKLKAKHPTIYQYIKNRYQKLAGRKFTEKCYWLLNDLVDFPQCPVCGNFIKGFKNTVKGYSICCSTQCGNRYKLLKIISDPWHEVSETNDEKFKKKIQDLNLDFHSHVFVSKLIALAPDALNYIAFRYDFLNGRELSEKLYWFLNGLTDFPTCVICGKKSVAFRNIVIGYSRHCPACRSKDASVNAKVSMTWKKRLEDPKFKAVVEKRRAETKLRRYGSSTWNNAQTAQRTRKRNNAGQAWTDAMTAKMMATRKSMHGDSGWNNQAAMRKTCMERYGKVSYSQTQEFLEKVKRKNMSKLGVEFPGQSEKCMRKQRETIQKNMQEDPDWMNKIVEKVNASKRKNGTFCSSNLEYAVKDILVSVFGEYDVFHQYTDSRYPFNCDFYISSQDLFIECNFFWTHGGHFFDESNPDDIKYLDQLKTKAAEKRISEPNKKNLYENVISVWTEKDPIKRKIAIENKINYVVFWNLKDVEDWIENWRKVNNKKLDL